MKKIELVTENIIHKIIDGIENASTIYILTAFIMKSGVELLKPHLEHAAKRGADIKICTGDYLYVTQPLALQELVGIHNKIEARMWMSNGVSFHPKAYIFGNKDESTLIVGSSNLSKMALMNGIEWNLSMKEHAEPETFHQALNKFMSIFHNDITIELNDQSIKEYINRYNKFHKKNPNLVKVWDKLEEKTLMFPLYNDEADNILIKEETSSYTVIQPRQAQLEALQELENALELGNNKALVIMATGLGKTYLAAFFAKKYQRVLFVAHREEILYQAKSSFETIIKNKTTGLYYGQAKDKNSDIVFASVNTLGSTIHLENFTKTEFDLIIIDEFHHAAAKTYQQILNYFTPKFLLGITATPDRLDGEDIYELCDNNIVYELHFIKAIQNQWLSPFKYYGIYDDTDYSKITWVNSHYNKQQLLEIQLKENMAEKILNAWLKHKQTKTIAFCSSIEQAYFLSQYFNKSGWRTTDLHSKQVKITRKDAIKDLESGKLDVIFTIDLFNEGVDIPSVDTLLFVRPTESLTIFTQQIGRGLRLHPNKQFCTIIDLIGNYRNADLKLSLLDSKKNNFSKKRIVNPIVPELCEIDLDLEIKNLFEIFAMKRNPKREKVYSAYVNLKEKLGRRPTYTEMHNVENIPSKWNKDQFNSYFDFLHWADELTEKEEEVFNKYYSWIYEVEKTDMNKSYKMILLKYLLSRGVENWIAPCSHKDVLFFSKEYFKTNLNLLSIEFPGEEYILDDEKKLIDRVVFQPMKFWAGKSNGLVEFSNNTFNLLFEIEEGDKEILFNLTKEICDYRLYIYFEKEAKKKRLYFDGLI